MLLYTLQTDVSGWAYFPNITAGIYEIDGLADSHSGADEVMSVVGRQALQLLLPYQPVQARAPMQARRLSGHCRSLQDCMPNESSSAFCT